MGRHILCGRSATYIYHNMSLLGLIYVGLTIMWTFTELLHVLVINQSHSRKVAEYISSR